MNKQLTPCLWFNHQAQEAASLYCSVFEQSKITAQSPIVTEIEVHTQKFILLDGGPMFKPTPAISCYYICEKEAELDAIWNAFTKEGQILMPLDNYPWGERYGWVNDKFGVSWQLALGKITDVGQKITPCLLFSGDQYGRVEEAIAHYSSIFENPKIDGILRYGADEMPDQEGKVKHAQIVLADQKLMLMESAANHDINFSEGVSLTVYCENQQEIDHYWSKLTAGGAESMCGWLKDKFGVSWQILPTQLAAILNDPINGGKAMHSLMTMRKINIEHLVNPAI